VARDPLAQPEEAIRRLYGYVAYRIGPGPEAEDVVSETLERALRYRDSYDHKKGSPSAWLAAIASRVIVDASRRREAVELRADTSDEPIEDFSALALDRLMLRRCVALLDDRSRELIALRYGADLKAREIAAIIGMETNAVEVALSRSLKRLRGLLEDEPVSESSSRSQARNASID
jgi:RNA polymerase sigma-70 factor (ECF subfamily)